MEDGIKTSYLENKKAELIGSAFLFQFINRHQIHPFAASSTNAISLQHKAFEGLSGYLDSTIKIYRGTPSLPREIHRIFCHVPKGASGTPHDANEKGLFLGRCYPAQRWPIT